MYVIIHWRKFYCPVPEFTSYMNIFSEPRDCETASEKFGYIFEIRVIFNMKLCSPGTNIHDALKTATLVAHDGLQNITTDGKPEPIIVFLTDGEPTVGEVRPTKIQSIVREFNSNPQASIFSLALGNDADFNFLKKLSFRNSGFARKIYEASDTALQLTDFYRQVASPLLANVTFSYQPDQVRS